MSRLVTTGQAAKELGVTRRSIVRWVRRGELEPDYVTPGGHYRWDVERLRAEVRQRLKDLRDE